MVSGLRRLAVVLDELPAVELSPDPDDNPVLAMAVVGKVDLLVTGDKRDLLSLELIASTRIVSARAFVEILEAEQR